MLSTTVTVAVQVAVFPLPSFTVRVTVFAPRLAQVNALGVTDTRFTVPQLSDPEEYTSFGVIEASPVAFK